MDGATDTAARAAASVTTAAAGAAWDDAGPAVDPDSTLGMMLAILPMVTCILCFLFPMATVANMREWQNTRNIPLLPFLSMAVQSTIWFGYGVATDNVTVMLPNAVGLVLGTGYTWVFHQHYKVGPKKALLQQYAVAASILVFVCAGVWVLPPPRSTSFLGFVAASGSVIFAFSPLAAVVTVFRQQSVASMPLKTSCILFCNGSLWTLYGTLVAQDPAIWVPNVLGTFGGSLQLVIHAFFALRSTTTHRATYDTLNTDTDASSPRGFASVIDTT